MDVARKCLSSSFASRLLFALSTLFSSSAWSDDLCTLDQLPCSEVRALHRLHDSTGGISRPGFPVRWQNRSGWDDPDRPCSFYGIHCKLIRGTQHVTAIDLRNNGLSFRLNLCDESSCLPYLESLDLNTNALENVAEATFVGLIRLRWLNLGANQLLELHPATFHGLSALKTLYLQNNPLTTIEPNALQGLNALDTLYLFNNQLTQIDTNAFRGLNALTKLYFDGNRLGEIPDLSALPKTCHRNTRPCLKTLSLTHTGLTHVRDQAFQELGGLTTLWLDDNALITIEPTALQGLGALKNLYLNDNQLQFFPDLSNLTALEFLRIDRNQFSEPLTQAPPASLRKALLCENDLSVFGDPDDALNLAWDAVVKAYDVTVKRWWAKCMTNTDQVEHSLQHIN